MQELNGKVAVVTGAASGIGLGLAERLATEGMQVALLDYEQGALDAAVSGLKAAGHDVIGVQADIADFAAVEAAAKAVTQKYGKVHLLVNNAGVLPKADMGGVTGGPGAEPLWERDMKDWHWTFGVNVFGVVHGLKAFLPGMVAHGEEAHVVTTASVSGIVSGSGLAVYGSSKHACVRLMESLYLQLKEQGVNIGATVLCPGGVRTNITNADRNRPEDMKLAGEQRPEPDVDAQAAARAAAAANAGADAPVSLEPSEVAEMVVNAVRANQFYLITHPTYGPTIEHRAKSIVSMTNPDGGYKAG